MPPFCQYEQSKQTFWKISAIPVRRKCQETYRDKWEQLESHWTYDLFIHKFIHLIKTFIKLLGTMVCQLLRIQSCMKRFLLWSICKVSALTRCVVRGWKCRWEQEEDKSKWEGSLVLIPRYIKDLWRSLSLRILHTQKMLV